MTIAQENRYALQQTLQLPRVLIVDDEQVICELCAEALSDYQVAKASSAEEALDYLEKNKVDLVLTDVLMQGMSGLELLQQIKRQTPEKPVIVMTGFRDRETVLRALQTGADDFIDKPIDLLELCTTVNRTLERIALEDQVRQLHHLDRLHNQFLGLISHKLKTPVTSISLLLQHLAQGLGEDETQTLEMALGEVHHLEHLIEDLLFFSDAVVQSAPTQPQVTNLSQTVKQVSLSLQPKAEDKGLQVELNLEPDLPAVPVDPERIQFALQAVLDNAIKFSQTDGVIHLSTTHQDGQIEIRIRDHGPGIASDEQSRIFERFYQVDPAQTGQVRGFGLGLYYAREFVHTMGGQLKLLSCPGEGTTVLFRFPVPFPNSGP